ncbi:MAG: hypothetical protein M0T84_06185 [Betaproteobacteria bacterium]|nr:hypothetical protein [Betaproteobacteria bacterium]
MTNPADLSLLERTFPRVLERIVLLWPSPMLETYFTELLFDHRGSRAGFPQEVMAELIFLHELYLNVLRPGVSFHPRWF